MSKKVGFPVMSSMLTGLLFLIGIVLATLGIFLIPVLGSSSILIPVVWFIGFLLFGWALLSYSLNPELEDYQRNVAFFFLVLLVTVLFGYGVAINVTVA
jgi:steroid 5-alpha reductase family enzyme